MIRTLEFGIVWVCERAGWLTIVDKELVASYLRRRKDQALARPTAYAVTMCAIAGVMVVCTLGVALLTTFSVWARNMLGEYLPLGGMFVVFGVCTAASGERITRLSMPQVFLRAIRYVMATMARWSRTVWLILWRLLEKDIWSEAAMRNSRSQEGETSQKVDMLGGALRGLVDGLTVYQKIIAPGDYRAHLVREAIAAIVRAEALSRSDSKDRMEANQLLASGLIMVQEAGYSEWASHSIDSTIPLLLRGSRRMSLDIGMILQTRMDKCTTEQFWAVGATAALDAYLLSQKSALVGSLPSWAVVWTVIALAIYVVYFIIQRHVAYYSLLAQLLMLAEADKEIPEKVKTYLQSWKGHTHSGVSFYSACVIVSTAAVVIAYL